MMSGNFDVNDDGSISVGKVYYEINDAINNANKIVCDDLDSHDISRNDDMFDAFNYFLNTFKKDKEREKMIYENKILELWVEKKNEKIKEEMLNEKEEFYNNSTLVQEFIEAKKEFDEKIETLYTSLENEEKHYICLSGLSDNAYKFELNDNDIERDFEESCGKKYLEKRQEVLDIATEVSAQLSLSDDCGYQLEVLKNYGILDKKSNKLKV